MRAQYQTILQALEAYFTTSATLIVFLQECNQLMLSNGKWQEDHTNQMFSKI